MSRVVRFHKVGGPEVLQIENSEVPSPGKGEVRLKIQALGINRAESMFRLGKYLEEPIFPAKLGYEASGTIESVGPDVKEFKIGDVVSLIPVPSQNKYGVYGDLAVVPVSSVIKHPTSLSFEEAAASWMQYLTAYGALFDIAKLTKGDYVIIPAASSSVGLAAIQLVNLAGGIPIAATRTSKKKDQLLKAGAKHVIATEEEDLAKKVKEYTNGKGARIIFDPVGGKTVNALADAAASGGIIIEYGALSSEPTPFPLFTALSKGLTMRGYVLFELTRDHQRIKDAINYIDTGLSSGKLKPIIDKTFKLDQIVEAHRYLESNQQFGKIIVTT